MGGFPSEEHNHNSQAWLRCLYIDFERKPANIFSMNFSLGRRWIFQQANDSTATTTWLNKTKVTFLANSRDFNPIENLWQDLKVRSHIGAPKSRQELKQVAIENGIISKWIPQRISSKSMKRDCRRLPRWKDMQLIIIIIIMLRFSYLTYNCVWRCWSI
jgi:hypothetical protein